MGIRHESELPHAAETVFDWHSRPGGFERLSPPWLPGRILEEAANVRDGRAVLALPLGLRAVAQHVPAGYQEGRQFADRMGHAGLRSLPAFLALPWRHRHRFEAAGPGRSRMIDAVRTPLGERGLGEAFRYRHRQLARDLAAHAERADRGVPALTIAVTGASGLVGRQLCAFLSTGGHRVIRLARPGAPAPAAGAEQRAWDPAAPDPGLLDGVDAVVHLAGASIFGRFTPRHRARIRDSRVGPTRRLAEVAAAARRAGRGPTVFVSASAIGYYGADRGDEILTEASAPGEGFLAGVVADWEAAAAPAAAAGIRTVAVRTGIVQSPRGGVLRLLRPLFAAGLGGRIGSGRQWFSWVGIDELVEAYHRAITDPALSGPVNAVAPEPARQAEHAAVLARVLRRPARLPVPAFGPRLLLGAEGARELALANQRVVPAALAAAGQSPRDPDLEATLRHLLGRRGRA